MKDLVKETIKVFLGSVILVLIYDNWYYELIVPIEDMVRQSTEIAIEYSWVFVLLIVSIIIASITEGVKIIKEKMKGIKKA